MEDAHRRNAVEEDRERAAIWAVILTFHAVVFAYVYQFGFFFSDDIPNFTTASMRPFVEYTFTFVDVHFIPLFQASNWLFLRLFGLNFGVAVVFLLVVQLLTVRRLGRLLERLLPGRGGRVWTFVYATNIFLGVVLPFWAAGLVRIPCLYFMVLCLDAGLRFVEIGRPRHAFLAVLGFVGAIGFLEKGLLAPAYLGGTQVCLWVIHGRVSRTEILRLTSCLVPMLVLGALDAKLISQHSFMGTSDFHYDPALVAQLSWAMFQVEMQGPLLLVRSHEAYLLNAAVWVLYLGTFAWAVIRNPRSLIVWLMGASLFVVNCVPFAASNRRAWAPLLPLLYRYYHELTLLFVLTGVLLCVAHTRATRALVPGAERLRLPRPGFALLCVLLAAYGLVAAARSITLVQETYPYLPDHRRRVYQAAAKVRSLQEEGRDFAVIETLLPPDVAGMYWGHVTDTDILRLQGFDGKINLEAPELYAVDLQEGLSRVVLRSKLPIYPGTGVELVRTFLDANRCFDARNPFGGVIEISLPEPVSHEWPVVAIEYTAPQPDPIFVFYRTDSGSQWINRQKVTLPAGANTALIPLQPKEHGEKISIGGVRVEMTVRAEPFCIRRVALTSYSLAG